MPKHRENCWHKPGLRPSAISTPAEMVSLRIILMELIVVVRCETCICSSDQLIFQLLKNHLQNFQSHLYYYVLCIHHCSFGMTFIILMICCLQVGDGHPMRLWRVSVEIEAPPTVVLQRVLRERHLWDEDLLHSRVIETLENNTEVFHYITDSMAPHPRRNFIVLRYTAAGNFFFCVIGLVLYCAASITYKLLTEILNVHVCL